MQAILTKYLPATNFRPARIKASCDRGSLTVSYPHELRYPHCHEYAANLLCERFVAEDEKARGEPPSKNPWAKKRIVGVLPNGDLAHVFAEGLT